MPLSNSIASATITLHKINETVLYKGEITSSNGNIFHPYDIETTLTFTVLNGVFDITKEFKDIEWTRYSFDTNELLEDNSWGNNYKGKTSITIDKNDFQNKCVIQADAYTVLNGKRTCVASARITLIDVNELYNSNTPPENPTDGLLWVDTSGEVPIIYSWNDALKKWVAVGKTVPNVRNLIMNSNFWKLNSSGFSVEQDEHLLNLIVTNKYDKSWLRIKSYDRVSADEEDFVAGISQTTSYPIIANSDYTLSLLSYCITDSEYKGDHVYIKILSLDLLNEPVELESKAIKIPDDPLQQISCSFKTLNDTKAIKVIIGIDLVYMNEIYVTEISLYNTDKAYPWEPAPEDTQEQLDNKLDNDHNAIFNALTKDGTMEGIYIAINDNGEEHFYFNASHIQTGSLDGGLINGIGLDIKDDVTGQSIFHVYKDENGTHIDMIANNLYIGTEPASTKDYAQEQATQAQINAASYTDTTVSTNRQQSEELLNGNIASSATAVTAAMTSYVDEQIKQTITNSEGYTDGVISDSTSSLIKLIEKAEDDANKYTDDEISDLVDNINLSIASIQKSIQDEKADAIDQSKSYTNDEIAKVNKSLEEHSKTMNKYIEDEVSAIGQAINGKADSSTVSGLDGRLKTVETATVAANIVSTVRSSADYINDLGAKLNAASFNEYKANIDKSIGTITGDLASAVKKTTVIADINASTETAIINKNKLDLSNLLGAVDAPVNEVYSKTMYGNTGILLTPDKQVTDLTVDTVISNMDFTVSNTKIDLDVSKIAGTGYVKASTSNAQVYIDEHEMIKLLLYQMKRMQEQIDTLTKDVEELKKS